MNRSLLWKSALLLTASLGACALASAEQAQVSYPLTISHALGETTLEEAPQRVVTIGWGNLDVPLALGIAPVGVSRPTYGKTDENGLFAWSNEAFQALGVEEPLVFDTDGLDFEAIHNAEPDLILAVYSGITEEEYGQLCEIAMDVRDITLRQLLESNGPDQVWIIGIDKGKVLVSRRQYTAENTNSPEWTGVYGPGKGKAAAIEFDGDWTLRKQAANQNGYVVTSGSMNRTTKKMTFKNVRMAT